MAIPVPKGKEEGLYPYTEFGDKWRFNTQKKGDKAEPTRCPNCGNKKIYLYGEGWYCDPDLEGCGYTIQGTAYYMGRNSKEVNK